VFPDRIFVGRQVQWPAQRIEEGASRAFCGRAVKWIAQSALIDDRRLPYRAVGIDGDPDFDDEIFGVARTRGNVPAPCDLLPYQVYFACCNLAAQRRSGLG